MPTCWLDDFWSLWCLDTTTEREAVYLCGKLLAVYGGKRARRHSVAEDPLPHLELQQFHITTLGNFSSLF